MSQKTWHPHIPRESRKKRRDSALHNVVSLRMTDEEKRDLERVVKASSKTVSDVLREALALWVAKRKQLQLMHD